MCINSREIWGLSSGVPLGKPTTPLLPVKGITKAEKTLDNTPPLHHLYSTSPKVPPYNTSTKVRL
jgi:hypothetical protein